MRLTSCSSLLAGSQASSPVLAELVNGELVVEAWLFAERPGRIASVDEDPDSLDTALAVAPRRRAKQLAGRRRQWSHGRVLDAAQAWAREVGVAPYAYDWDRDAARKIGREESQGVQKWTREYPRWPSTRTATALFGSWRGLLTEAELPSAPPLRLTLSERLDTALRLRDEPVGVVADIIGVSESTVRTYWGAGRCPRCGGPKVTENAKVCASCVELPGRAPLSRETVIAAIAAWTDETGAPPLACEWMLGVGKWDAEYPRWPALHQVQETLGSWNAAIVAAGLDPRQRRWSAAAIIQAAQRCQG